jgi:hypothetical protein
MDNPYAKGLYVKLGDSMGVTVGGGPRKKSATTAHSHECRNCGAPAGMAKDGACYYCGVRILPDLGPWLAAVSALAESTRRFAANPCDRGAIDRMRVLVGPEAAPGKPVFG